MTSPAKKIFSLIKSVLSGNYNKFEINELFNTAYQISLTRLKQLIAGGRVNLSFFQLSLNSAAIDCISELFRRDQEGNLVEFKLYFSEDKDINLITEDQALKYFRRLVFFNLEDGIIRLYNDADPVYGKILRNLKDQIRNNKTIKTFDMFKTTYIYSCDENNLNRMLPKYPIEEIEIDVSSKLKGNEEIPDYLEIFLDTLNNQETFRRFYSLSDIASVIKRIYFNHMPLNDMVYEIDDSILKNDIKIVVIYSVSSVKTLLYEKYVSPGKMSSDIFDKYFCVIKEIINRTFIENENELLPYYDYVAKYFPNISKEEYRENHHNHFECMVRIALKYIREKLKELL